MQYVLTDDEKAQFSSDDFRAELRARLAQSLSADEHLDIVDSEGNLFDRLSGPESADVGLAVTLSDDEREARLIADAEKEAHASYLEAEIRPLVMRRLTAEAKAEVRDQLKERTNESLRLRAQLARLEKANAADNNRLRADLAILKAKHGQLQTEHAASLVRILELETSAEELRSLEAETEVTEQVES